MYNFSMSPLNFMKTIVLFFVILVPVFKITGAQPIGVCYGRNGVGLTSPGQAKKTIDLLNANRFGRIRLYDPVPEALDALRGTNIEVILDVPNSDLESLSNSDPTAARAWVQNNILSYTPGVNFRYIAVGNEVDPNPEKSTSKYVDFVLPAMQNVHKAIVDAGLQDQIKVSTATYSAIRSGFPPSQGSFLDTAKGFIVPIIEFLEQNNLPLLANIYPYFSYLDSPPDLPYALFTAEKVVVKDPGNNLEYRNLFDALVDTLYSAVENAGGPNIEIVVSESGWPSAGGREASFENAQTYVQNLIDHVRGNGTPKRQGKSIETYIFAMYDEDMKEGPDTEKHFGLFDPAGQSKYQLNV
ncbi:hypothetical protein AgCh_014687 [Apium graveolens]